MLPREFTATRATESKVNPHRGPHTVLLPEHDIAAVHVSVHEPYLVLYRYSSLSNSFTITSRTKFGLFTMLSRIKFDNVPSFTHANYPFQ